MGSSDVLSPDSSLTKIWKFSEDGVEDVDVEEAFDDDREVRMLGESVGNLWIDGYVAQDYWLYQSRCKGEVSK